MYCQTLSYSREWDGSNHWVYEEPLFFSPLISVELLCSATVRSAIFSKICHLRRGLSWIPVEELAHNVEFRSERFIKKLLHDFEEAFSVPIRDFMKVSPVENCNAGVNDNFPELHVSIKKKTGRKMTENCFLWTHRN